jgi:GNAT superfamily N-acetyltransferase
VPALNEYLRRYARQNHQSGGAKTFVALSLETPTQVLGYHTISPGAIAFTQVPGAITKRLGRSEVPVFRLGRLAIAVTAQRQGLGSDLLLAAGERALAVAQEVGGVALAIDAKDQRAAAWYARFGALRLLDDPLKLVLPLETITAALRRGRSR